MYLFLKVRKFVRSWNQLIKYFKKYSKIIYSNFNDFQPSIPFFISDLISI